MVKLTDLKFKEPKTDTELNSRVEAAQAVSERDAWVQRSKNLLNEVNDLIAPEDRELLSKN